MKNEAEQQSNKMWRETLESVSLYEYLRNIIMEDERIQTDRE